MKKRFIRDLVLIFAAATLWLLVRGWLSEAESTELKQLNPSVKQQPFFKK